MGAGDAVKLAAATGETAETVGIVQVRGFISFCFVPFVLVLFSFSLYFCSCFSFA